MAKHIELRLYDCSSYAKMKQEVARLVDSGSFGSHAAEGRKKDDGIKPMEIDYFNEQQLASMIQAFMKGGKGKGKGKGTGKNSYSYSNNSSWNNSWNAGPGNSGKAGPTGKGGAKGINTKGPSNVKGGVKGKGKGHLFDGYCNACWQYGHATKYCPLYSSGAGTNSLEEEEQAEEGKTSEEEPEHDASPGASETEVGEHFAYLGHLNSCVAPPSAHDVSPRRARMNSRIDHVEPNPVNKFS